MKAVFALIDCNNFFVSCERIFRPDLEGKPVVVMSSGDGCVVARSNEAKTLGIPMGAPVYKWRQFFKDNKVAMFSGNFELYGNISRRITDILTTVTPQIEIYSVDESFLDLSELKIDDYVEWGRTVSDKIRHWIGVPVSVGIAPTKILAKLAADYAKKHPQTAGALSLTVQGRSLYSVLEATPVNDVWGVGGRLTPKLGAEGIHSALQLSRLPPRQAQQLLGVRGRQLVAELNGISCYLLEQEGKPRQSIARTRTFGEDTSDIGDLEAALASFATKAAFRLRTDKQLARQASVFAMTNRHKPGYRSWSREARFLVPTADTGRLIATIINLFHEFYNPRVGYHRAGVRLEGLISADRLQTDILGMLDPYEADRSRVRMQAFDAINQRFGRSTIHYAAEKLGNAWEPKQQLHSPRYVSRWDELPIVHSK